MPARSYIEGGYNWRPHTIRVASQNLDFGHEFVPELREDALTCDQSVTLEAKLPDSF